MYYDPMECGVRISKLRMELGKTQQQLADKLNISLDHYRALENGRRGGSLDLLIELAITFDVSLDYLVEDCRNIFRLTVAYIEYFAARQWLGVGIERIDDFLYVF